ncbi:hypothetical protein [Bradyrhizobium sp. 30]|uniref:hypothetical protein n=1 Tax=Bradyrhizobium sp. 30 TaxID=2782669 RepID=UPI001FF90F20|nr:hypothetical protein [Bradyrhizobium sp. 30]
MDTHHFFWFCLVMSSLKKFLFDFVAPRLRVSPASLYERQRELVRGGLLPVRQGRGPGSGVPLTPDTLAIFLIGLLATDGLTDLVEHTSALCSAKTLLVHKPTKETRYGNTFQSDLAKALAGSDEFTGKDASDSSAHPCAGVQVTRHWRGALLQNLGVPDGDGDAAEGWKAVEYIVSDESRRKAPVLAQTVSLEMEAFWLVSTRLREELGLIETARTRYYYGDGA